MKANTEVMLSMYRNGCFKMIAFNQIKHIKQDNTAHYLNEHRAHLRKNPMPMCLSIGNFIKSTNHFILFSEIKISNKVSKKKVS